MNNMEQNEQTNNGKASIVKTKNQVQKQEEAKLRDEGVVGGGSPSGSI